MAILWNTQRSALSPRPTPPPTPEERLDTGGDSQRRPFILRWNERYGAWTVRERASGKLVAMFSVRDVALAVERARRLNEERNNEMDL